MSPELETLDQLLGGEMPVPAVARLYPDAARFTAGLTGLLRAGEVRLVAEGEAELPAWQWAGVLADPGGWPTVRVQLTRAGIRRIE